VQRQCVETDIVIAMCIVYMMVLDKKMLIVCAGCCCHHDMRFACRKQQQSHSLCRTHQASGGTSTPIAMAWFGHTARCAR